MNSGVDGPRHKQVVADGAGVVVWHRRRHVLFSVFLIATMLMISPLAASPLSCNSIRSMAYPCSNEIAGTPLTDDNVDALSESQPHFSAYLREQAFGHCSWVGGIVYRCPEIVDGDNAQIIIRPPGSSGSDPGGPEPGPMPIPEPQMATPIALATLCGLVLRAIKTAPIVSRGSL